MLLKIISDNIGGARNGKTYRNMRVLMIDVDECPVHIGENFNLVLELLANIMGLPQGRIPIHNDINFYEIFLRLWLLV